MAKSSEHFVYVYRDEEGNPVYFGQGKHAARAASHKKGTHNEALERWLATKAHHSIEVIGPVGRKEMADALETALISACLPAQALRSKFFNQHKGRSEFRFRPFGVPSKYADRITELVDRSELLKICRKHGPLIFVRINQKDFDDGPGRRGYDLASPPSNSEIHARIEAWWQVAKKVPAWIEQPECSPALLIGVTGAPGAQSIVASSFIERLKWDESERDRGGLLKIPLAKPTNLDALALRGRPISSGVGLRFNAFRHSQFRILTSAGFEHEARQRGSKNRD